jgi:conjugative relaxase-like TrwC/TraI family protein
MSLHVLHAGAGYRYLLRTTAAGDGANPADGLAAYYAASGTPPGVWVGGGLAGLNDGHGLPSGLPVDETTLGRLFGHGHDPVTDLPLGRGLATRRLPDGSSTVVGVAGFDLTFTVPKSASVLWALGDPHIQAEVLAAHHATINVVLGWAEREIVVTRTGHAGATPLRTRGVVAARFDHYDSRAGDPNLHSHLALANRVQGEDGVWRALDARLLHAAGVAMSELYDTLFADELTRRLGVTWHQVDRGPARNPGFEIAGIDPGLIDAFSTRSHHIAARTDQLIAAFTAEHGRPPSGPEVTRLRQTATLATRPAKTIRPLTELQPRWRRQAAQWTADTPEQLLAPALPRPDSPTDKVGVAAFGVLERPVQMDLFDSTGHVDPGPLVGSGTTPQVVTRADLTPEQVGGYAAAAVAGVEARRSSWTPLNLMAETARATREVRMAGVTDRMLLLDRTRDQATEGLVALHDTAAVHPAHAWRAKWTSPAVLQDERTLLAAAAAPSQAPANPNLVRAYLAVAVTPPDQRPPTPPMDLPHLTAEQARAIDQTLAQARVVQVLVGPAGSGKTTTLRALSTIWRHTTEPGHVQALAPSATAAATLQAALGVPCETTAKWLHESTGPAAQQRAEMMDRARATRTAAGTSLARDLIVEQQRWTLPQGGLLIVDEASLTDTRTLAELAHQADAAGARVLLVGDPAQHDAVGAGGAFGLLARRTRHAELAGLHRYIHAWEAQATLRLRNGDPAALHAYITHHRMHAAPTGTHPGAERDHILDAAVAAWAADQAAGKQSLLLAADSATAADLNARARTTRVLAGQVSAQGRPLRDGTTAGIGDLIRTRHNTRGLTDTRGHWIRNGDPLHVATLLADGSLIARRATPPPDGCEPAAVHLPAPYVAEHVDLGYALTTYRAQSLTTDTAHLVLTPGSTREALYVGMTRGRDTNHTWVTTTPTADDGHDTAGMHHQPLAPLEVLKQTLATTSTEPSATEQLHTLHRAAQNSTIHRRPQITSASSRANLQRASIAPGPSM